MVAPLEHVPALSTGLHTGSTSICLLVWSLIAGTVEHHVLPCFVMQMWEFTKDPSQRVEVETGDDCYIQVQKAQTNLQQLISVWMCLRLRYLRGMDSVIGRIDLVLTLSPSVWKRMKKCLPLTGIIGSQQFPSSSPALNWWQIKGDSLSLFSLLLLHLFLFHSVNSWAATRWVLPIKPCPWPRH